MEFAIDTQLSRRSFTPSPSVSTSGVNGALSADAGLVPASLVADTTQKAATPFVSPDTVIGEVGPSVVTKSERPLPHKAV